MWYAQQKPSKTTKYIIAKNIFVFRHVELWMHVQKSFSQVKSVYTSKLQHRV